MIIACHFPMSPSFHVFQMTADKSLNWMFSKQLECHCSQCLAIRFVLVPTGELLGRCKHSFLATRVSHKMRHFASERVHTTPPTLHALLWEKHPGIFYQEYFFLSCFSVVIFLLFNYLYLKIMISYLMCLYF